MIRPWAGPRGHAHPVALAAAGGLLCACAAGGASSVGGSAASREIEAPYPDMPTLATIGSRIGKYLDVPAAADGPAIPAGEAYRIEHFGAGLYMITDNAYQSMFLVYDQGVVVVDAPPSYAAHIPGAVAAVTRRPITHVVYSHAHRDHIGGTRLLGGNPVIIAHEETARLLRRAADPDRPVPTVTFTDRHTLRAGGQVLELSYHGNAHEPGNIFIEAPAQRVLMVVDVVFPGWMPWRRLALAQDLPGYVAQVGEIGAWTGRRSWGGTSPARAPTPTWPHRRSFSTT